MNRFSILLAIAFLYPAAASAVPCHAVDYFFAPTSDAINSANIVKSGWGKFSLLQTPVPPAGWFYFMDGQRAFALNQNQVGPLQWGVDMQSVTDGSDCDPTLPSPLDPADGDSPLPADPNVDDTLLTCVGNSTNYALSFSPANPSAPVTNFTVERLWGGSWDPWYDGGSSCIYTQVSGSGVWFRVKAQNSAGDSDYVNVHLSSECGGW